MCYVWSFSYTYNGRSTLNLNRWVPSGSSSARSPGTRWCSALSLRNPQPILSRTTLPHTASPTPLPTPFPNQAESEHHWVVQNFGAAAWGGGGGTFYTLWVVSCFFFQFELNWKSARKVVFVRRGYFLGFSVRRSLQVYVAMGAVTRTEPYKIIDVHLTQIENHGFCIK